MALAVCGRQVDDVTSPRLFTPSLGRRGRAAITGVPALAYCS